MSDEIIISRFVATWLEISRNYNAVMKRKMSRKTPEDEARYYILLLAGRIDLACQTLDVRRLFAPHRLIFISGATLEELSMHHDRLPLASPERQVADSIIYSKVYAHIPVFSNDVFADSQLFGIVGDVFVMDCSFAHLSREHPTLFTTISPGLNTIEVPLHEPSEDVISTGSPADPHACMWETNIIEQGRDSFIDWTRFIFSSSYKYYEDSSVQNDESISVLFNSIYSCKCCGTCYMSIDTLSPSRLKTEYEARIEALSHG